MRRALPLLVAVFLLASCASSGLDRRDVPDVVREAFRSAGLEVTSVKVTGPEREGRWPVNAAVAGEPVRLEVDGEDGRVSRIEFAEADSTSREQLEAIGRYSSNPSDETARRWRRAVVLAVVLGGVGIGLWVARRRRLSEAGGGAPPPGAARD